MGHSQHVNPSTISLVLANQVEDILNGRDDQFRRKRKESSYPVTGAAIQASRPSTVKPDSIVPVMSHSSHLDTEVEAKTKELEKVQDITDKLNDSSLQSTTSDGKERNTGSIKKVKDVTENLHEVAEMIQSKKRLLEFDEKDKQPVKRPKTKEEDQVKNKKDTLDDHEQHNINEIKKESVEMDVCKCDEAVKARAIKDFLENSKELDSNLIVKKVKEILDPYTLLLQEENTEIKTELVSVSRGSKCYID